MDKRKGVSISGLSGHGDESCDDAAVEVGQRFILRQERRSDATAGASDAFSIEVPHSMEGLDPYFCPDRKEVARVKGRNKDFSRIEVDPKRAFDPVPNVVNTESILFNDSDVESHMVKAMTLSYDRHAMCYNEETTEEFAKKLCESVGLVIVGLGLYFNVPILFGFFSDACCFQ